MKKNRHPAARPVPKTARSRGCSPSDQMTKHLPAQKGRTALQAAPARALLAAARAAATHAYCPYSRFAVGAALLADNGRIFTGVNVENASYGLTICAERAAMLMAVATGARRFRALAVAAGNSTPATPCGACRQVLAEFCDDHLPVFCSTLKGNRITRTTLGALLPMAFRLKKTR